MLSSLNSAGTRFKLRLVAVVILVIGLSSAVSIWVVQDRVDRQRNAGAPNATEPVSPDDSRRYTHDVEMYYGQSGLLAERWKRSLQELTHGKPLAYTIAGASLASAGALLYVAGRLCRPG